MNNHVNTHILEDHTHTHTHTHICTCIQVYMNNHVNTHILEDTHTHTPQ